MLVNLVNYAVSYAEKGFSVIPIGQSKKPLIEFAGKPPLTPDEVGKIWRKYPLVNIAFKTDKFFVIDVDRHSDEADGMESTKNLHHDEWFKDMLTERTAHDGFHFFFTKPKDMKISQNIEVLPSMDLKAYENNCVVAAPSSLGDKKYRWLDNALMKAPPQGLLNLIKGKQKDIPPTEVAEVLLGMWRRTKTTDLLEAIINGLGNRGKRNDNLTSFIDSLPTRNVNPYVAAKLAVIANDSTVDPSPLNEVGRTVNSMIEKENRKRRGVPNE